MSELTWDLGIIAGGPGLLADVDGSTVYGVGGAEGSYVLYRWDDRRGGPLSSHVGIPEAKAAAVRDYATHPRLRTEPGS